MLIMFVRFRYLLLLFMPRSWTSVGQAAAEFKLYMKNILGEESSSLEEGKLGNGTLMTSFVRASGDHQKEGVAYPEKQHNPLPKILQLTRSSAIFFL